MEKTVDDTKASLIKVVQRHGKPLVSLLLDVQESQKPQTKYLEFIENLECLSLEEGHRVDSIRSVNSSTSIRLSQQTTLNRRRINAFNEKKYVALSYTWEPSECEDSRTGKYRVQTRDERQSFPSPVRDCVFDRVFLYMQVKDLSLLWVDRHCVKQKTCRRKGLCHHARCNQKQADIQTMDLVYKLSKNPVALLGKPIEWQDELDLLFRILTRKLVYETQGTARFGLLQSTSHDEASRALALLSRMTRDRWWTRAWTFQENYRAGPNMTLLIPHAHFLEERKRSYGIFSNVPGELCIKSVDFCEVSTALCLAVQAQMPQRADVTYHAQRVLSTIGKYTVLLDKSMSMSPYVISDIQARSLCDAWDKLAIIANCCQYMTRMKIGELQRMSKSLSLSILAMYLLNGEILHNGVEEVDPASMSDMTVSEFLKVQTFKGFCAPRGVYDLTFNKGCRFPEVQLRQSGIKTEGHIWKLGRIIQVARIQPQLPVAEKPFCSPAQGGQEQLAHLVAQLRRLGETYLANEIENYLNRSSTKSDGTLRSQAFPQRYMQLIAVELAAAIDDGRSLRLGRVWDPVNPDVPYAAIFIWDGHHTRKDDAKDKPQAASTRGIDDQKPTEHFVFTATKPMVRGSEQRGTNDVDRHVSLEVTRPLAQESTSGDLPQLYIRRWLLGLCFFYRQPKTSVIFPWPSSLTGMDYDVR